MLEKQSGHLACCGQMQIAARLRSVADTRCCTLNHWEPHPDSPLNHTGGRSFGGVHGERTTGGGGEQAHQPPPAGPGVGRAGQCGRLHGGKPRDIVDCVFSNLTLIPAVCQIESRLSAGTGSQNCCFVTGSTRMA